MHGTLIEPGRRSRYISLQVSLGAPTAVLIGVSAALLALPILLAGCGRGRLPQPSGTFEVTTVDVAPLLSGQTLRVTKDEGEHVAAGDTLIVLDTELIALRRAEAAARRGTLQARRGVMAEDLAQAQRQLALLETTLERTRKLSREGSATQQQVDDLSAQRDVARSRVAAARGQLSVVDADLQQLEASLAVFDRQLRDGVVTSPLTGTVLVRALEPGEVATVGRTALRLADLTRLDLRIYLEESDLDLVHLDQELPVLVDALPGRKLSGRVIWISDEAEFTPKNAQTRQARAQLVYAVKLRVANPDGRLHVGMPAEVELR
jgi:HlyD family secretion protein